MALVKEMTPSALDAELRILQIVNDEDADDDEGDEVLKELQDIALLMDFFIHQVASNTEFEFVQALVQLFLKVREAAAFFRDVGPVRCVEIIAKGGQSV